MNRGQEVIVEGRDASTLGGMFSFICSSLFLYLIRTPVAILAWRSVTDKSSHPIFWHSIIAATTGLPSTSISAITSNFESSSTELNSPRSARYYYALSSYRKQIWSTSLATHAKPIGCHRFRMWSKRWYVLFFFVHLFIFWPSIRENLSLRVSTLHHLKQVRHSRHVRS